MIATGAEADGGAAARGPWLPLVLVVALGLAVHGLGSGRAADTAGDALYAAMVYLLLVVVRLRRPWGLTSGVTVVVAAPGRSRRHPRGSFVAAWVPAPFIVPGT